MKRIHEIMEYISQNNLYPDIRIVEGCAKPETIVDKKKVLMFSSNNYLGLSEHPQVVEAAIQAIKKYGVGSDGSRLLSGNLKIHRDFEKAIAEFKGGEDAIVWNSGYSANIGLIRALMDPLRVTARSFFERKSVILSDSLNHASIIDGARISRQKTVPYNHCDMNDLEKKLKRYKNRRKIVITDSVFSMDGDIAPLPEISRLCKKYNAISMIDEAHATGILGKNGHGSLEHFNLKAGRDIDIVLGTCSKALAASGGFVVANKEIVDYLRVASRSYMFSTAMLPASSAALIEVLKIIELDKDRRDNLWRNVETATLAFKNAGFDMFSSKTQIIPILIGKDSDAIEFSRKLYSKGFFAPCVRWPAVPKGQARIRFTLMSTHTTEQITRLVKGCEEIAKELNIKLMTL